MEQSYLLSEIKNACGLDQLSEEKLCRLPYLAAVFHETLRKHSPVPVVPLRYVHEETQLGGYNIPEGSEVHQFFFFELHTRTTSWRDSILPTKLHLVVHSQLNMISMYK